MKLKHLARLITTAVPEERPAIALESVGSGTMRLLTEDLPVRSGLESGVASVEPGDVLFGKLRPYLAKTWRAEFAAHASTELLCLRPAVETVDSRWFAYLAASQPLVDWATSLSDGAKMPRTSWERLRSMEVDVPRLETQRSIVDFLDAETSRIDDLLRLRQGHLALLGERQRSEISALVSEGEEVPLRRVIALRTSGPRGWAELVGEKGAPFVRSANLRETIELGLEDVARIQAPAAPEANRSRIARGDVLIGITGANTG